MISGIYEIRNLVSLKKYIGSSKDIKRRWSRHRTQLNKGQHSNRHLQNAYYKYGCDSFEWVIVLECESSDLLVQEQKRIDDWPFDMLYNIVKEVDDNLRSFWGDSESKFRQSLRKSHAPVKATSPTGIEFYFPSARAAASTLGFSRRLPTILKERKGTVEISRGSNAGYIIQEVTWSEYSEHSPLELDFDLL